MAANSGMDIGINEVRQAFQRLEKEAAGTEKRLLHAAQQVLLDEEQLDALYAKFQELDTDCRQAEFTSNTSQEKSKLLWDRTEEIEHEIATIEAEFPARDVTRSSKNQRQPHDAQEVSRYLERLCQRQAFAAESFRRIQDWADVEDPGVRELPSGHGDRGSSSHQTLQRSPVDSAFLKISEGNVLRENLEWELVDVENRIKALQTASTRHK